MDESHSTSSQTERELARLHEENESLRSQLEDSQETLLAIQEGAVDALVIDTPEGQRVFTLEGADHTYRAVIEQMQEGAVTLTPDGIIHYCNERFAKMLKLPLEQVDGQPDGGFRCPGGPRCWPRCSATAGGRAELALLAGDAREVPVLVSAVSLLADGPAAVCLVVADLTERKRHETEIDHLTRNWRSGSSSVPRSLPRPIENWRKRLQIASGPSRHYGKASSGLRTSTQEFPGLGGHTGS